MELWLRGDCRCLEHAPNSKRLGAAILILWNTKCGQWLNQSPPFTAEWANANSRKQVSDWRNSERSGDYTSVQDRKVPLEHSVEPNTPILGISAEWLAWPLKLMPRSGDGIIYLKQHTRYRYAPPTIYVAWCQRFGYSAFPKWSERISSGVGLMFSGSRNSRVSLTWILVSSTASLLVAVGVSRLRPIALPLEHRD